MVGCSPKSSICIKFKLFFQRLNQYVTSLSRFSTPFSQMYICGMLLNILSAFVLRTGEKFDSKICIYLLFVCLFIYSFSYSFFFFKPNNSQSILPAFFLLLNQSMFLLLSPGEIDGGEFPDILWLDPGVGVRFVLFTCTFKASTSIRIKWS